jgi:DNA-binding transcriptional regulator YiaG
VTWPVSVRLLPQGYTPGILARVTSSEFRQLRRRVGLTQLQLSQALGVRANTVARWERGELRIGEPAARLLTVLASNPEARQLLVGDFTAAAK